jgi:hypothetical protein
MIPVLLCLGSVSRPSPAVHLAPQVVLVPVKQRVASGEDLARPHARIGRPDDGGSDFRSVALAVHPATDRRQRVDFLACEDGDVLATAPGFDAEPREGVLVS